MPDVLPPSRVLCTSIPLILAARLAHYLLIQGKGRLKSDKTIKVEHSYVVAGRLSRASERSTNEHKLHTGPKKSFVGITHPRHRYMDLYLFYLCPMIYHSLFHFSSTLKT